MSPRRMSRGKPPSNLTKDDGGVFVNVVGKF